MGRLRPIEWGAIAIAAVLYAAFAYLSVTLTRGDGGFALLWLPGGFLIGWLLRRRGAMAVPAILACMLAHIPVVLLLGDTFYHAVGRAAAHAIDAGLTLAFLRAGLGARPDMAVPRSHLWLIGSVGAAVAVGATVVSVFVLGEPGTFELDLFALWYAHNVLSLLLILPVTMIMIDLWRDRGNWNAADFHRAATSVGVVAVGTALVFWQNTIPLLFLISPLLLFAAFRSGLVGSAFAIIAVTVIATAATWLGHGPIQLVRGGRETQALALQIFLVASFLMCIPLAAVLQERDRVRLAAAAARDEIREIVDNVRDIIFRTDAAGRWTALNHAWEDVTGYTVAESLGTPTTTLLHPDDHAEAARLYPKLAAGEVDELLLEQHFIARNGKVRNIVVKVRRVVDAEGRFAGTVGNIADVTEMAERTRALARSEENFRLIAQNTPVGLFRANPDGHLTYMSPNWMERLGRKPAELMGDGWLKALADASMFRNQPMWLNFQPGEVRRRRIPFNGVDGKIVWMDIYTSAGFDENGNVIEYNGAAVDITEQRHALERLAESEEELRLITDNVTDSVLRLGLDGVCRYASPSVERLFELPAKALVGHVVLTDFHPDDEAAVKAAFARLTSGESDSEVVAFRSRSPVDPARYRWMEASCALIRDESGQPKEVLASLRDVSRNKALEAELRAAQERAEAATTAKSAFLANMSHELRTPMNGVIGYANLLAETDLDAKQREQVEAISESSQSMMTLLNDILDLSKIEAGQMEIVNEPVDLPHKLRGAVRLVDSVARAKGIALDVDIDAALPRWIAGDPLRLRQIVLNLVGNAVKFTQVGGVSVTARRAEDGKTFTIAVKDSGIGIAPENVEAIFEQFAQGDNTIARRFGGTGLGLSICSRLAAMMGGGIAVKSELGKGSTFTLTLPLEPALPPSGVVQGSNGAAPGAEEQIADAHVLVVEDNAINRGLIAAILGGVGIKPAIATNGREAIEAIEAADSAGAPYDLVLMDVQMPEIDGLAATRHLRANGFSAAKLPIVALTANAFAEDIAQCRAAGMQAHLAKPIVKADLYAAIAKHRIPSDKTRAASSGDEPERDLGEIYADLRADLLAALVAARGDDAPDTTELQELAHQIAGTAAVFGEPELGEAAAHLDKALRDAASVTDRKAAVAQWDSRITEAAGA